MPMPMSRKHAKKPHHSAAKTLEALVASPAFEKLEPTEKLVAMLRFKDINALITEGRVFNAKLFGERVGYSYDHVRRLCRAGKLHPAPVMLGAGKVWKEYYFLPEHIDAVFAARPS